MMPIKIVHEHVFPCPPEPAGQSEVMEKLAALSERIEDMSNRFDELVSAVQRNSSVVESAVAAISGIAAEIAALKVSDAADQAEIDRLAGDLNVATDALAAAVPTNTPADPNAQP